LHGLRIIVHESLDDINLEKNEMKSQMFVTLKIENIKLIILKCKCKLQFFKGHCIIK
jgi:hypothetical protein